MLNTKCVCLNIFISEGRKKEYEVTLTLSQFLADLVEWSPVHSLCPIVVGFVGNPGPQQTTKELDEDADSGVLLGLVLSLRKLEVQHVVELFELVEVVLRDNEAVAQVHNFPRGRDLEAQ